MQIMKMQIIILFSLVFAFYACKEKQVQDEPIENQLSMKFIPTFGAQNLKLDSVYITDQGFSIKFTKLKLYLTEIKNGGNLLKANALFDFEETGTSLFTIKGEPNNFTSLTGNIGVPASRNHADPTSFPSDDPLNILIANDMHWGWSPGYIFMKIEAKVDTVIDAIQNFNHNVVFHVGGDSYLQSLNFPSISWDASGTATYEEKWKLDMQKFLNNGTTSLDLKTEFSSHTEAGQEAISLKVMQQLNSAIGIY